MLQVRLAIRTLSCKNNSKGLIRYVEPQGCSDNVLQVNTARTDFSSLERMLGYKGVTIDNLELSEHFQTRLSIKNKSHTVDYFSIRPFFRFFYGLPT
jgi:hypothetical protein